MKIFFLGKILINKVLGYALNMENSKKKKNARERK